MSFPFQAQQGQIEVEAELEGPAGKVRLLLALDTGATDTAIRADLLRRAGHDPAVAPALMQVTTASGPASLPELIVNRLTALGYSRTAFAVLALMLSASAGFDGVLGLDFLRGHVLTIDFCSGQITLT